MAFARLGLSALLAMAVVVAVAGQASFDASACERNFTWDLRDWVVDYLRPTVDLGGKASRKSPYQIDTSKKKDAFLVNNEYPGPVLEAIEGELVCVTVINNLIGEPAVIHWHGVDQRGSPSMDGVYGITQAGIDQQGGRFTYRFRPNSGTHMYHAHMQALQADRGLKGVVVIHAKNDPHKHLYQEERIVAISDEWQQPGVCLRAEGAQPGNPVCAEIDKASWNGVWGDGSSEYPWPLVEVEQGKCYRLRFVGLMGQTQNFQIQIAGHNMTLIAIDGEDVQPQVVSQFNLHAGERADLVVCADQTPGKYAITATYDLACFLEKAPAPSMPKVDSCNFWSFLSYKGFSGLPGKATKKFLGGYNAPDGAGGGKKPMNVAGPKWDTNLRSGWGLIKNLVSTPEPEKADVTYVFDIGVVGPNYETGVSPYATTDQMYMFTEIKPWKKPASPLLHTKGQCGTEGVPFITVEKDTVVEIVLNNLSPTAHVLHMHGNKFSVINAADFSEGWCSPAHFECFFTPATVAKLTHCKDMKRGDANTSFPYDAYWGCPYNAERDDKMRFDMSNPLQKDMISIWRRSWAVIRFKADSPGVWLFHCHMEQHIPTGQVMAFNIRPQDQPPIPSDMPTEGPCPVWSAQAATRHKEVPDLHV